MTWVSEKVVKADIGPSASEEEAVGCEGDLGEAAEAEAVMEKIELRLKTQDCFFEGFQIILPLGLVFFLSFRTCGYSVVKVTVFQGRVLRVGFIDGIISWRGEPFLNK